MKEPILSVTIKDCVVQTFRAGGKGGQHQNKTETGVRVVHPPSGATGEARDSRSQADNKKSAFFRMANSDKFQSWLRLETSRRLTGKTIEQVVEEQIGSDFLKVEVQDENGRWVVDTGQDQL